MSGTIRIKVKKQKTKKRMRAQLEYVGIFTSFCRAFVSAINETRFQGVSGYISFDGSDRLGALTIQQFFHNETNNIGKYLPQRSGQKGGLDMDRDRIRWLSPVGAGSDVITSGQLIYCSA